MNKDKKKILLICGISQTVITFRLGLIKALQKKGHEVVIVALDDDYKEDIIKNDVEFYSVSGKNRSLNPFEMQKLLKNYRLLIRQIEPDIVFTFMLKPNIFGVDAARKEGVKNIFSMVEGAGDVFINNGFKWKIIRFVVCKMYRKSFNRANKVFFLNTDDKKEFVSRKLVRENQCELIPCVGIDTEYFAYKPMKNYNTFIMIARMLKTKGVIEYCKAARIVKQKYPNAVFNYLGAEGTLKTVDIQEYLDDGSVNYLGVTKDVRPYLEDCSVNVLPSYREGFGLVNAEAGAVGRLSITSDTIGTKNTVINGHNGFLVDVGDYEAMAEKMIWCIENPSEVEVMGQNSCRLVEEKFDKNRINEKILGVLNL